MVTVKEVFDFAVETDLPRLAHSVYWAIANRAVQLDDDSEKLNVISYNGQEIERLVESNMLGIGRIKLFVIQTQEKDWFAFYLAENSLDAFRLHVELFRDRGGKITHADRLMIPTMFFPDTGIEASLYEHRKNVVEYPAYVGHAKAGERVLYRAGV
ncbi:hypothetical protein OXB_3007 [Bacillus sp. OxB-1]|uniref:hypothetical protein n=1 Tax=Bacillus sp. (strain OxB-1) TaxID=98228 RepID=UPI0005820695|nr:hypothetical protein [Bacillus sp. OxB-1]BAQ11477.1 hypothetical protein OXB_3007 [Bacillus sp. OxB-1]